MLKENMQMQIAITMNPGYAGRTELPDNLKVLFRPVAMMIPDYTMIAQIMLFAEGFEGADQLARKMTRLYTLSSEQLSCPKHYDFGMRAVKSVLNMAGRLKRGNPDMEEAKLLIEAMIQSNVPKFLNQDLPLFDAIIGDLFPGIKPEPTIEQELYDAVVKCIDKHELMQEQNFINKVMELDSTFQVRFGVMLIGPTYGGKTSVMEILRDAHTLCRQNGSENEEYQNVTMKQLNPKAITMAELYG
jgi:dynein heavy chain, axonemal